MDYTTDNANRITQATTANALVLGGAELQLKGGSYAQELGNGGGTTFDLGQSRISRISGSSTIALGSLTRNAGALADFEAGVAKTTLGNYLGILGTVGATAAYTTADGSDWATVAPDDSIVAFENYDTFDNQGTDKNVLVTGSKTINSASINTLKIVGTGGDQELSLTAGNLALSRGGLLFTGSGNYSISSSPTLSYSGGLAVHHYGSGNLTINSQLSGGFVQKGGPGLLTLANSANNNSTMLYILEGTVAVHDAGCLGTGNLSLNGGTLQATAGFSTGKSVAVGHNGATFQVDEDVLELSGVISGIYSPFTKTGTGTLLLSGNNTFGGPVTVSEGTLQLGHSNGLGPLNSNGNASSRSFSPVKVTGNAIFDIAGLTPALGNFTLESGTVTDSEGGGTLGAYSFTLIEGVVDAVLTNAVVPRAQNPSHSINLTKSGEGTATINSTSLYSGHTFVDAGTLLVNGALPYSPAIVRENGTLGGNGTLSRSINVENGTLSPGSSLQSPSTLTLERHLRIDGGTLRIEINKSGFGQVKMTNPAARVLLEDAELAVDILEAGVALNEVCIIDNQGSNPVEGTFRDLPEGAKQNYGSRQVTVSYKGGDGNDVVLTFKQNATYLIVR